MPCASMWTRLAIIGVAALAVALPAHAVPSAVLPGEQTVVGKGRAPPPADSVGTWTVQAGEVTLSGLDEAREHWWLPKGPELADGFARVRLTGPRPGRVALVLRASVDPKDPRQITGYGALVGRSELVLGRWDRGRWRPLDKGIKVAGLGQATTLEIAAWLVGPHLGVQVLDGSTLQPLASASVSDTALTGGRIGVHVAARKLPGPTIELLTLRPARTEGKAQRSPAGTQRYVAVRPADTARLALELRNRLHEVEKLPDGRTIARVGVIDLELLQRAGLPVELQLADAPFRWQDRGFLQRRGQPPEPTATGFRIDHGYKDAPMVEALLRAYADRFPHLCRLVELGRSTAGRPLLALKISDHPDRTEPEPPVLLNGAHHGDELLSIEFALDAVQGLLEGYGSDPEVKAWVDGLEIWVVPVVNPDGVQHFFDVSGWNGRKKPCDTDGDRAVHPDEGVDLNRNYPFRWQGLGELGSRSSQRSTWYRGPRPGSEPETQAMMQLADAEHFAAALSFHTLSTVILAPYTIDGVENPQPNEAWRLAERLAQAAPRQPNGRRYHVARKIYSVDGVDQDWHRFAHGTAALLLEGPYHNPPDGKRLASVQATRPTWRALLDAVLRGPAVSGVVRDAAGQPVVAEVVVVEQAPRQGERWTTRCRDGRFTRLLAGPGPWTLRVTAPGQPPVETTVQVAEGQHPEVTVVLPKVVAGPRTGCVAEGLCAEDTAVRARQGLCPAVGVQRLTDVK